MKGVFEILVNGKLETYHDYRDIPEVIDAVIRFVPDLPPTPHSDDDHEQVKSWTKLLQDLVKKETNGR